MGNVRGNPRFSVEDHVFFLPSGHTARLQTAERYVVTAVMPLDRAGNFQYRIRPVGAGPHRMATELELRR